MGQPKKSRRRYSRPKRPYDKERIVREKKILKDFGLRRKHEIWKAENKLRNFRRRARELLAEKDDTGKKELFDKLNSIGFRVEKLDDVLDLKLEDILSRRLQTFVFKKGLANTLKQARQLIVHRHVIVGDRKEVQLEAINAGASLLIITGNLTPSEDVVKIAKEKGVPILLSPYDTYTTARLVDLSRPVDLFMERAEKVNVSALVHEAVSYTHLTLPTN